MSEKITKTYQAVIAELTFNTALHVGTGRDNPGTDAPVRRNNAGDLVIPGTAIAGALRTLATRIAPRLAFKEKRGNCFELENRQPEEGKICDCAVCHLFGEFYPNKKNTKTENDGGRASRLWIYDAQLTSKPADTRPFVRDGVGIDRRTGVAASAAKVKFDTEVVPAGARFELRVELEDVNDDDQMLLAATLAEWRAGRAWLGGNTGRGLGNAKLDNIQFIRNELSTGEDLLKYLKEDDPKKAAAEDEGWLTNTITTARDAAKSIAKEKARPFIAASFKLAFDGPFLMHDATAATVVGFDHLPLLDAVPGFDEKPRPPIMAGSGLRGVLRSHAERIARTIATINALKDSPTDPGAAFLEKCPACNPLEDRLDQPLTRCDQLLETSTEYEKIKDHVEDKHLCLGCLLFGSTVRGSRLKVMDAKLLGEPRWKPLDFLAIDRFTGGGLEGAKFDAMALWRPTFEVQLHLEEPQEWEMGWLALVLRDMKDKRLTFGFGAAKGFGNAQAQEIEIQCGFLQDDDWGVDFGKNKITVEDGSGFYRVAKFSKEDWEKQQNDVSKWVKAFHERLKRKDETLPDRKEDTYFGKVDELYPLMEV